ncbi:MAG TPA: Na+/H+ antiporter NhaA, partial [Lautropia sp.]|nr:Na+/H+ antiporter NhaA [Lautropia sp.]
SSGVQFQYLALAAAAVLALALLNRSRVYRVLPYMLVGLFLWACVHASGLHATLAGVLLAMFIPTRPTPNLDTLMTQADLILKEEARHGDEVLRHGPSLPALRALDDIHDRLESPADRLLRHAGARSSYLVLPLFALANAGVTVTAEAWDTHQSLMLAIGAGLVIGKPVGLILASVLAVLLGLANKPETYSWQQLCGAGSLAGIGFTMSLFIAGQAFPVQGDFAAAKVAVLAASLLSGILGSALLWHAGTRREASRTSSPASGAVRGSSASSL